jgi:hypothetical protein
MNSFLKDRWFPRRHNEFRPKKTWGLATVKLPPARTRYSLEPRQKNWPFINAGFIFLCLSWKQAVHGSAAGLLPSESCHESLCHLLLHVSRSRSRSRSPIVYLNTSYTKVHTLPPSCPGCYADLFRAPLHEVSLSNVTVAVPDTEYNHTLHSVMMQGSSKQVGVRVHGHGHG